MFNDQLQTQDVNTIEKEIKKTGEVLNSLETAIARYVESCEQEGDIKTMKVMLAEEKAIFKLVESSVKEWLA